MADPHTLMNEILPVPEVRSTCSPRERVTASLQRLVALSAVAASACHLPVAEQTTAMPKDQPTVPNPSQDGMMRSGYAVVDPMPPPARCKLAREVPILATVEGQVLKVAIGPLPPGYSWREHPAADLSSLAWMENQPLRTKVEPMREERKEIWTFWLKARPEGFHLSLPLHCEGGDGHVEVQILGAVPTATVTDVTDY